LFSKSIKNYSSCQLKFLTLKQRTKALFDIASDSKTRFNAALQQLISQSGKIYA